MGKKAIIILAVGVTVLLGLGVSVYLVTQQQDQRSRAAIPTPAKFPTSLPTSTPTPAQTFATSGNDACPAPQQVSGVLVEYPGCEGDTCLFAQASCKWNVVADATSYNLVVTEVDTGNVVRNESIPSSTTKVVFPITQGNTYRCEVSATNACGSIGLSSTHELLCQADALIPTEPPPPPPTSTPKPTFTPAPTATATPTAIIPTATPTIEDPGAFTNTVVISGIVLILIVGGIFLLVL